MEWPRRAFLLAPAFAAERAPTLGALLDIQTVFA